MPKKPEGDKEEEEAELGGGSGGGGGEGEDGGEATQAKKGGFFSKFGRKKSVESGGAPADADAVEKFVDGEAAAEGEEGSSSGKKKKGGFFSMFGRKKGGASVLDDSGEFDASKNEGAGGGGGGSDGRQSKGGSADLKSPKKASSKDGSSKAGSIDRKSPKDAGGSSGGKRGRASEVEEEGEEDEDGKGGKSKKNKEGKVSLWKRTRRILRAVWSSDGGMQYDEKTDVGQMMSEKSVERKIYRMRLVVMLLAILGLLFGIGIIEWCWRGYIPTPQEEVGYCYGVETLVTTENECVFAGHTWIPAIENPINSMKGVCETPSALAIKAMGSFLTVALLALLFRMYQLHGLLLSIRRHDFARGRTIKPFWQQGLGLEFCVEAAICFVHPPPGLSFDIFVEARGRTSVYNVESVLVSIMFLRCYLIWTYYREWLFARYTTKNFASRMNDVPMDSKLAIKAILDDQPFYLIAFAVVIAVLILGYLIRLAEAPVNSQHVYFWNQLWLIVVTLTATGYGDLYPITHLGRLICCIAMVVGAFLLAVLTATVSSQLTLNAGESRLMLFLQSERWEKEIRLSSIRAIQSWWRRSITHPKTLEALRSFRTKKRQYRKFLEATPHFGAFVSQMKEDNQRVADSLSKMEQAIATGGFAAAGGQNISEGGWTGGGFGRRGSGGMAMGGGRGGGGNLQGLSGKEFESLVHEVAQLKKTNEQLAAIVEKHTQQRDAIGAAAKSIGMAGGGSTAAAAAAGGGGGGVHGINSGIGPLPGGLLRNDPALVASEAVEERIKRLEGSIANLDQGMAKCLGQVVRLLQGLY